MTPATRASLLVLLGLGIGLTASGPARAAGLYFSERGTRPLGRGGAFVAGADDLHSTWFNPAGLADAKSSVMVDLTAYVYSASFTRESNVTDASGATRTVTFPTVTGKGAPVPIPLIGASYAFGENKEYTAAFSIYAPNTPIGVWPDQVNGEPAPQRYTILSLEDTTLVVLGGYFAWKPIEEFRVGAGLQALVGSFVATTTFNANPNDRLLGAPEDPSYDAVAKLDAAPIFAPSANFGITAIPEKHVRIGVSAQLPFAIRSSGKLKIRLPEAAVFDKATQEGEDVKVRFNLPLVLRAGVEARPIENLRIEAAYVREFWSTHRSIDVTPENVNLLGITGFPSPFKVVGISLPKSFEDTHSFRLGGEMKFPLKVSENAVSARLGAMYEPSAIPDDYVSAVTIDMDKVIVGLGGSFHAGEHWRFDALVSHVFAGDVHVDPATAKIGRVNPVKGNPTETEAVNGGTYSVSATMFGLGANYTF
jgi:long-chain fatty acid transport protein